MITVETMQQQEQAVNTLKMLYHPDRIFPVTVVERCSEYDFGSFYLYLPASNTGSIFNVSREFVTLANIAGIAPFNTRHWALGTGEHDVWVVAESYDEVYKLVYGVIEAYKEALRLEPTSRDILINRIIV